MRGQTLAEAGEDAEDRGSIWANGTYTYTCNWLEKAGVEGDAAHGDERHSSTNCEASHLLEGKSLSLRL